MTIQKNIASLYHSVCNSYAQVFFSENKVLGMLLILTTFTDYWSGIFGFLAILTSYSSVLALGFDKNLMEKGIFGFNPLLVGLGMGVYFEPSWLLFFLVIIFSILTLLISVSLKGVLYKYNLPFLSIPFLLGIWFMLLSTSEFSNLGLNERGIFDYNDLFELGGISLVKFYDAAINFFSETHLKTYFLSLGAIFFQGNIFAGVLVSFGLLYYSRIVFVFSLIGFFGAVWLYNIFGIDFNSMNYTFIGFNFILTSIALGSYFLLPNRHAAWWSLLMLPIVLIVSISTTQFFTLWLVPVYSLPFNIVVLLFIYSLKLRLKPGKGLVINFVRLDTPENTVYLHTALQKNIKTSNHLSISLPFWGTWKVMQAHNGDYTHQKEWKYAWDFIIENNENKSYKTNGEFLKDYYCYEKNVVAPADGYVVNLEDGIVDNAPGEINTHKNWGNTIVIKHDEYVYSQLSHLKAQSLKVKIGDFVKSGEIIAQVGNSGHSPYPHLHFQIQNNMYIGSYTLEYPLDNYFEEANEPILKSFDFPKKDEKLYRAVPEKILSNALKFYPGQKFSVKITENDTEVLIWEIKKNAYNETYIFCNKTKASAYFYHTDFDFSFQNFYGETRSLLFVFFSSLNRVSKIQDISTTKEYAIRPDLFFNKGIVLLQDFTAWFYLFIKIKYKYHMLAQGNILEQNTQTISTEVIRELFMLKKKNEYKILIHKTGEIHITYNQNNYAQTLTIKPVF